MLGFPSQVAVRYVGVFLATGAYVSNWAALSSYQANNVVGQWHRAVTAATVTAFNGLGGVAGSCKRSSIFSIHFLYPVQTLKLHSYREAG